MIKFKDKFPPALRTNEICGLHTMRVAMNKYSRTLDNDFSVERLAVSSAKPLIMLVISIYLWVGVMKSRKRLFNGADKSDC